MKYLSVCSGIEAATVAWHPLGWQPVGFSEIEKFPSQVLAHHYPNVPNLGDMTKFKEWNLESNIDVFVGGTPCQSFSVAGLRKGLDDPRGNLMLTYLAIADKHRPRWLVWENVPGVLSSNGGKDFGTFLGGLGELGYGFAYRVLDAQYFGVAQRRRRVFVVGYLGDWRRAAAVLFERHSLSGNPAPRRQKGKSVTASIKSSSPNGDETIGTLMARDYKGIGNQDLEDGRGLVLNPIALAENTIGRQPENGGNTPMVTQPIAFSSVQSNQFINAKSEVSQTLEAKNPMAVAVGTDLYNGAITGDVAATMTKSMSGTGTGPTAMQPMGYNIAPGKGQLKDDIHVTDADTTKTLDASGSNPAMHQGGAAIVQPVFFEPRSPDGVPRIYPMDGAAPTLNTMGGGQREPCVTHSVAPSLTTNDPSRSPQASEVTQQINAVYQASMAVRRLTPIECERLQGFGDNYTDIQPKGKPTPDGPRYKALGNSMAVPVMAWIGKRIQEVERLSERNAR